MFAHNYVEVPAQTVQQLLKLGSDSPNIDIKLFDQKPLKNTLLVLGETSIDELNGYAATEDGL